MNYNRIYEEFIIDRREKEKLLKDEYTEKHHIIPRCMGGLDNRDNLIRLTPEDHFFAHLLLAKIHGGKNWISLGFMAMISNKNSNLKNYLRKRKDYSYLRKKSAEELSKLMSGPEGICSDKTIYKLRNKEGEVLEGNSFYLSEIIGCKRSSLSPILRRKEKSVFGWYLFENGNDFIFAGNAISESKHDKKVITLFHYNGSIWKGTKRDFKKMFNRPLQFQSDGGNCAGFYLNEEFAKNHKQIKRERAIRANKTRLKKSGPSRIDKNIYKFEVLETGEIIEVTKSQIKERFPKAYKNLNLLFLGKRNKVGGLKLANE